VFRDCESQACVVRYLARIRSQDDWTMKRIVGISAAAIFVLTTIFVFTFSPLADGLFNSGNDTLDDIFGLLAASVGITVGAGVVITGIVASCMLARRLGYDQMNGLFLLIPVVNILVFFYWAFRESPNEQQLRMLKQRTDSAKLRATETQDKK